jgi:hypothetical protein
MNARLATSTLAALALIAQASFALAQPAPRRPPPAAPAAPVDEVEAEHLRGLELRRQHRDGEARDLFRALYERTREARALAWLAGAEGALGEWVSAEAHLATALETTTDPWINQLRDDLTADLAGFRQRLGLLEVLSSTPGAAVLLAGVSTPIPMQRPMTVRAGAVTLEVRAEGYLPEVRTVEVPGGMRSPTRETVNLTARPAPVVDASGATRSLVQPLSPAEPASISPVRIVGAALLGLGAVGVGLGIYGLVDYSKQRNTYVESGCDVAAPPADCAGADDGSTGFALGVTGLTAGGLFVAGGLTMLLIPLRSTRRAVSLGGGPGDVGLSLRAVF